MKLKVFSIPFHPEDGFNDSELQSFCSAHDVVDMKEYWFEQGGRPWLAVLTSYRDPAGSRDETIPQ